MRPRAQEHKFTPPQPFGVRELCSRFSAPFCFLRSRFSAPHLPSLLRSSASARSVTAGLLPLVRYSGTLSSIRYWRMADAHGIYRSSSL